MMGSMEIGFVIALAFVLDLVVGDPSWFPHPVRGVGHLLSCFEKFFRKKIKNERNAGIATALASLFTGLGLVLILLFLSHLAGKTWSIICSVMIIYFSIAPKDLSDHAMRVKKALDAGNFELARKHVSFMVGRDTDSMSESDIIRATVESVAENTVDGVLSPLFWAFFLGPAGALGYRIINTLDSMFGHKNEKYLKFGWFSARLDDVANYIPARIGLICFAISAKICGLNWKNALFIGLRDGQKHPSPNSGISEAAMAGALGIQLGGRVFRKGVACDNPLIGEPNEILDKNHVRLACVMMLWTSGVFVLSGSAVSVFEFF
ncbi:adenosylcobinamide-phosphate synthase CbiB [Desulforegula conservatrix]|uniref:adenosylcobinamide-phosphate synthase CbiB n=1 Tax=Desulforegula conservatrix TaxID=153026 RepID=UPI00041D7B22|nr:adenosylcobinamide-phosphate synthase CbiB [Desulforegula conservatrix]